MKIAKQGRAIYSSPQVKRPKHNIEFSARETRLIHRMARNTPEVNRRLGKFITRQRHCIRNTLGILRRYARSIARLSPEERQAIRNLQDSPFYLGLGSVSFLQRNDLGEPYDTDELEWLFGGDEESVA